MSKSFKPGVGKNAIETLTVGMYDAPYFIYREYVQNAADAIDSAVSSKLLKNRKEGLILISIDKDARQIIIEDNATGIEAKFVQPLLGNIAQSTKNRFSDKGFRGIGRLGGLGYCNTLTYETSYKGEKSKSIMKWDAKSLRGILDDPAIKIGASELISVITDYSKISEKEEKHFLKIILEEVTNDDLLDIDKVLKYLSMVAPVPLHPKFSYSKKIYKEIKTEKLKIEEYNVKLNNIQLFKGYKDDIMQEVSKKLKVYDKVIDIEFFKEYFGPDLLYWGWYGITREMRQIPIINNEKYIRLRKSNIQIGLETRLNLFHKKETGNKYYIGEVYGIHKDLIPNGRRDFFIENSVSKAFEVGITKFFESLNTLFYDFSKKNSAFRDLGAAHKAELELKEKKKKGISSREIGKLNADLQKKQKKAHDGKQILYELVQQYKERALAVVISEKISIKDLEKSVGDIEKKLKNANLNPTLITDNGLSEDEKNLLSFIYEVIRTAQTKGAGEVLISKIEKEIQSNYLK